MTTIEITLAGMRFNVEAPAPEQVASLRECLGSEDRNEVLDWSAIMEQLEQILHPADWSTIRYRACQRNDPFEISHLLQLVHALTNPHK